MSVHEHHATCMSTMPQEHHIICCFSCVRKPLVLCAFSAAPKGSPRNGPKVSKIVVFCLKLPKEFDTVPVPHFCPRMPPRMLVGECVSSIRLFGGSIGIMSERAGIIFGDAHDALSAIAWLSRTVVLLFFLVVSESSHLFSESPNASPDFEHHHQQREASRP